MEYYSQDNQTAKKLAIKATSHFSSITKFDHYSSTTLLMKLSKESINTGQDEVLKYINMLEGKAFCGPKIRKNISKIRSKIN